MIGKVYIIGAGPGDYKLLTIKALECIKKADVIVYDRLVSDKILSFAREDAEMVYVGKLSDFHAVPQDGINAILVEKALSGKSVARVKGGDPFVFGRGGEEAESLIENGIEFEIVPGITSGIAVPAYAGIPVTHRDFCSSLHIITGHERPDREGSFIDYENLAKLEGTLVFFMGVKNLPEIAKKLISFGKEDITPVAVIEKGTTSEQRTVIGTLKDISEKIEKEGVKSPAITVIGKVVNLSEKLKWFPKGQLVSKKIIVTRSREQASKLVERIEDLGGEAIEFPTIKIENPESFKAFDYTLDNLEKFNWLVFTSPNGVDSFFKRMREKKIDIRKLYGLRLCAVGKVTEDELANHGLKVDFVPEKYTTEELLKGFLELVKKEDKILLARADIGNKELSEGLRMNGNQVEDLVVYRTVSVKNDRIDIEKLLEDKKVDAITFTSSSTVNNFVTILGSENLHKLKDTKILCIGPVTAATVEENGLKVTAMADTYTIEGLMDKILEIFNPHPPAPLPSSVEGSNT